MADDFKFEGSDEVKAQLKELRYRAPEALGAGLYAFGLDVMRTAKRNCPVDTGRLRASGFVASPEIKRLTPMCRIGFGTDYAPFIHEGTKYMDGRKFLSRAIEEKSSGAQKTIAEQAMKAFEKGTGMTLRSSDTPTSPQD